MKTRIFSSPFSCLPLSYLLLTFLTLFAASVASAQIPSSGLVGYWPFNGNANDESGNGNNGTVNGPTLTTDRFGNANSAYSFGAGNVLIPLTQQMVSMPERTISLWFRSTSNQGGGRLFEATNVSWGAACYNSNNIDCWYQKSNQAYNIVQQTFPSNNIWYNLVYTCDSTNQTKKLYLNGVLINSGTPVSNPGNPTAWINHYLKIGQGLANESFAGQIDDIAIYGRSLTSAEIAQIYTSQTSTVQAPCPTLASNLQTGLVGYWPFCGNANDESGNGNNGTVNGATLTTDRFGNANSAYLFNRNSTSEINFSSSNSLNSLSNITISMWVKLNSFGELNQAGYNHLINKSDQNNNHQFVFANNSSQLYFYFAGGANAFATNNLPPLNQWSNLCLVYNYDGTIQNSYCKFYIDGILVDTFSTTQSLNIVSENLKIGSFGQQSYNRTDGAIDEVQIWNRPLSSLEVTQLSTDATVELPVVCTPFLGEDQTVCAGTSVTLSASGSSLACPTLPTNLQNGLVGYWPFCGNANDASGNGNNGTVNGATLTTDRFGNANSAYSFDGVNDGIITPDSNFPYGNSNRTMSFWMKNENTGNSCSVPVRYGIHSTSSAMWILHNNSCNPLYAYGSVVVDFYNNFLVSQSTVPNNEWHFISVIIQGQSCKLYIDGILQGETTTSVNTVSANGSFYIGADLVTPGGLFFHGFIDDVSIYNRALTASEIQQLFTLGQSTYLWSTGATTASINVTPTTTTTYTCTVTDANGNACTDNVTFFVPQIEATDLTICEGETTTLSVSGINSSAAPSACPTLPANLQNGLVGYWPFCGNANDASGNGNNGTVNGATLTTDRFGNANSAYSFDGNDHILTAVSRGTLGENFSISFYEKFLGSTNSPYMAMIGGQDNFGGTEFFIGKNAGNSSIGIQDGNYIDNFSSNSDAFNGNWNHVVVIRQSGSIYLYRNGILEAQGSFIGCNSTEVLVFGNEFEGPGYFWIGQLDDLTIYNHSLTIAEVQQLYILGQTTYLWSNGATTSTINVSPTTTTTYTCTITTNGVSCTDSVTVVVNNPVIDLGADIAVCGSSTTLTAPSGYDSYLWSNGGTTNTTTVASNGTYSCTVTQGGCSATDSIDVTLIDASVTASDTVICAGETVTLSVPQGGTISTACATLPANLQNGLVGYWPFCGNANDASGNGNNGVVSGPLLSLDRNGNQNASYHWDGVDDYISINPLFNGQVVPNYSISVWFKPESSGDMMIWGKSGYWKEVVLYKNANNRIMFFYANPTGQYFGSPEYPQAVTVGDWNHVVVSQSNGQLTMYLNGQFLGTSPVNNTTDWSQDSGGCSTGQNFIGLGRYCQIYNYIPFLGNIDDLAFWERGLSASEAQQLYTLDGASYIWSNGATTPTINVSPTVTTTYTCTITTNGVSCTDQVTVVVNNPTINLGSDITACGSSTTLTAPSGYVSYLWSNGGTTNTTTVNANGTYSCTVTQGGCSATDAIDVMLINATVSASDSTICAGQSVTLSVPQGGSTSTACAALPTNLQTGLIGYWPFCGNANDASGNGNHGTVNGATLTTDRFGNANSAYSFDGNDFVEVAPSILPSINNKTQLTFAYWFNASGTSQGAIWGHWSNNNGGVGVNCGSSSGYGGGLIGTGNYSGCCGYVSGQVTPYSTWHLVTIVFDASQLNNSIFKIYIDGVYNTTAFGIANPTTGNGTSLFFGRRNIDFNNFGDYFTGLIDDLAVWNRAFTTSEVQQLYTLGQTTYLWSNGATTPTINISPTTTTTYTCTVTTNGVSCTDDVTVVVDTPLATITPATATTFCQGGSVVLNANTGTGLSYQWYNNASAISGATIASYTANASGSYIVVVTNTSTCSSTSTATVVTVNALPTATITPATTTTFCQGGSVVLNANTGAGLSYQWRLNGTNITGATSASYTANASGSYTVVVTNASTCSSTSAATVVTVNALPTATITPATATTFCQGGSVVLNANTGTGLTYQWFNNAAIISGATSASYTANASGSYTVVVTNTSTCSSTSTATVVTVNALPTATITPVTATTFCQGGSVVLNANTGTGLSYQWYNNAVAISGATSSSYTANASGSYTVVVTNTSTCSATSTATVVTVNAPPTATITPATATTFCQGGSVVLNANTGTGLTYQWRLNGTNITGATSSSYTANASGSYTVVVTNTSTCSATSAATVVTVNALPTATITPATATTFCQGGSVVLNANTGTGLSYQWFNNAAIISGATSASYTANASGSYTVVVTNTSTCSATSAATVVTVNALPTATITAATATTFCQGGSVVLNANTGAGLSYQWRLNGTNITGATSSSYTANASGSYTVVVTNTSTCSATSAATVVTVNALPTATITAATATTFCQGGSVVLNANTGTGLTYQWRLNGTNITGATSSSYTANASGSYTVVVTNTSTCSATSTATLVTVNTLPTATITPATVTTFCQGGSVVLTSNTGTGLTYQWRLNGTNITGATSSSYTANASGSYTVVVTNTSTCSSTSAASVVTVNALPTATITPATVTTFCQGGSVVLNANTGTGLSYQWYNNAAIISGATSASYTANASGSYTVVVTNTSTCSSTSSAIDVTAVPNVDYFADADGDGFGDVTTLISTCVQPQGYVTDNTDCDDTNFDVSPSATEVCNHIDDDCSGTIDDGLVFNTYYADVDGDSYGDANNSIYECSQPNGYVTNNTDCNDNNANQNTASTEICNGEDDDCDGQIDNGLIFLDYYADLDSDGFGAGAATNSCVDLGAGYVTNNTDCNNANALINPNATEICNSIDDNCNGQIDEGITFTTYYQDFDNDGFGTGTAVTSCSNPGAGWVTNNTDCDDTNGNTNPNATETCNTIDDNCDGQIDEGVQTVYFIDNDGDTYGNPSVSILACTQPIGYTTDDTDCNDTDANINPGAEDIAGNGIDENCDGQIDNSIFELNAAINLYPNPTRSELNIQVNSSIIGSDLYIFDAVGKLVYKQQLLSTQTTLPVSNFADGNYVVRVGEVVKRFEVIK